MANKLCYSRNLILLRANSTLYLPTNIAVFSCAKTMDIQFDISKQFEKDQKVLSKEDQRRIGISIDRYAATFDPSRSVSNAKIYQIPNTRAPEGLDSSLYVLRATDQLRVILTIEDDPLFDARVVTLLRAVRHDKMERVFNSIAESFFQAFSQGGRSDG